MWKVRFLCNTILVALLAMNVCVDAIGVNWGTVTTHSLPPKTIIQMLKDNGINKVKLFEVDSTILNALAGSGLEVMIGMGNGVLQEMNDPKKALAWVQQNVTAYKPTSSSGVNITMVGVGNEPFLKDYKDMFVNYTAGALENVQKALNDEGLGHIKATIPFNGDVYYSPNWNPVPSAGKFRPDIADPVKQILKLLDKAGSPFMVNIYPFLSLYFSKGAFPLDFAFFDGEGSPLVEKSGVKYTNVFDANLDTLVSALTAEGYGNMSIIVGEMGWPTDGDSNANATLAGKFYNGLAKKLASGKGTPLRPSYTEVYFFALMDEDAKSILPGDFERHWGILGYDGQPKFNFDLSGGDNKTLQGAKDVKYLQQQWCVLKSDASDKDKIKEAVQYACDRADCTPLGNGSSCGGLDSAAKTSYAFNAYFQATNQANETCDFSGLATLTTKDPSSGNCKFNIQIANSVALAPAPAPGAPGSPGSPPGSSDSKSSSAPPTLLQVAVTYLAMLVPLSLMFV